MEIIEAEIAIIIGMETLLITEEALTLKKDKILGEDNGIVTGMEIKAEVILLVLVVNFLEMVDFLVVMEEELSVRYVLSIITLLLTARTSLT